MTRIGRWWVVLGLFAAGCLVMVGGAFAQAVEVTAGYAAFVDDAAIGHGLVGARALRALAPIACCCPA